MIRNPVGKTCLCLALLTSACTETHTSGFTWGPFRQDFGELNVESACAFVAQVTDSDSPLSQDRYSSYQPVTIADPDFMLFPGNALDGQDFYLFSVYVIAEGNRTTALQIGFPGKRPGVCVHNITADSGAIEFLPRQGTAITSPELEPVNRLVEQWRSERLAECQGITPSPTEVSYCSQTRLFRADDGSEIYDELNGFHEPTVVASAPAARLAVIAGGRQFVITTFGEEIVITEIEG